MRKFFERVLQSCSHPSAWFESFMVLLPKTCKPLLPKDLRPICLTSHLGKSFSRLVMSRIMQDVQPRLPHQCCAKHRQSTDYIWSMVIVLQVQIFIFHRKFSNLHDEKISAFSPGQALTRAGKEFFLWPYVLRNYSVAGRGRWLKPQTWRVFLRRCCYVLPA